MDNKVCFMFGHATTPYTALPLIEAAAERHYLEYGIKTFIVGNRGNFDSYAATAILLFTREEKECCVCDSFRYHAPCLIDLETGDLIELDLYFPDDKLVAELENPQPEMGATFSFVSIGNVSGIKLTDSKTIKIHIPSDKIYTPALCNDCRKQLPFGHTSRYIFADLYGKEEKVLMPIQADTTFTLRCYDVTTQTNTEKGGISVDIQGTLGK